MLKELYQNKKLDYFSNVRVDVVSLIKDERNLNILEIGGGAGSTLLFLKNEGIASEIHLFDLVDLVEDKTQFDSLSFGDVENKEYPVNTFDIVILADVLEHLMEPQNTIKNAKNSLKNGGKMLISLPNIRFIKALYKIFIKGSFEYEESGIFDKTHMRFFCKSDMIALFTSFKDLKIASVVSVNKVRKSKLGIIDKFTFGIFTQFLSYQFLLVVEKNKI